MQTNRPTRPVSRSALTWIGLTVSVLLAAFALSPHNAGGQAPAHPPRLPPPATPNAGTEEDYAKGNIDFGLLRQTVVNEAPPPVFPDMLTRLDGQTVRIKGFMVPYDDLKNLRKFMLMPTSGGCFFCQPPSINQVVFVEQPGEKSRPYINRPVEVEGTLHLWQPEGSVEEYQAFLFVITNAQVHTVP